MSYSLLRTPLLRGLLATSVLCLAMAIGLNTYNATHGYAPPPGSWFSLGAGVLLLGSYGFKDRRLKLALIAISGALSVTAIILFKVAGFGGR
jgi:hypothetical protein